MLAEQIAPEREVSRTKRLRLPLALIAVVLLCVVLRLGALDVPLERDEGVYAYGAQLLLDGVPPYRLVYDMRLPGIYVAYALILAVFGETTTGIHLGLLFANAASALLLFVVARRLVSELAGVVASASFVVLSCSEAVQGIIANNEHFVILPALAGLALLLRGLDRDRRGAIFAGGVLLGCGFVVKQHGAVFVAAGGLAVALRLTLKRPVLRRVVSSLCIFGLGALAPYLGVCAWMVATGMLDPFWFWTVTYAIEYTGQMELSGAVYRFLRSAIPVALSAPALWSLAFVGFVALPFGRGLENRRLFLLLLAVLSAVAIAPGLFFRPHYYMLLLPAASILVGVGVDVLYRTLARGTTRRSATAIVAVGLALALGTAIAHERAILFELPPEAVSRRMYGKNPFPESVEIARYIQENSLPSDSIAVIGSEPQIYFYSGRRAATGFIYTYPLVEDQPYALRMQEQMIAEIEGAMPEFVVLVNIASSWRAQPSAPRRIFEWSREFMTHHYEPVGMAVTSLTGSEVFWDPAAAPKHSDGSWLLIGRRMDPARDSRDR